MISWLNFEELLIHNPIELINFSKSNIQVALSKKQYIDFFSNKAVYMGLYYDEEMDFCVMFYADPLQSYKSGEMYAEGYIDVDMKIYRVKVLSDVSIKYPPNFNLLEGTKHFSGDWVNSGAWTNDGTYKGLSVKKRTGTWQGIHKNLIIQNSNSYTFSAYVKGTGTNIIRFVFINGVEDRSLRRTWTSSFAWTRDAVTLKTPNIKRNDVVNVRYEMVAGQALWTAGHKWEKGDKATPYMPSESEATSVDFPKWNVTKTGMRVSPQSKQITMVQAGALMRCEINNNISGWTDGTTQLEYSGQDFVIDGYGMRGLHNG
ncbi:virion structural protein [Lactococcus phage 05802]|uniref:Adhesion protein B n=1 Tax=Lactococcus phage 05802 TaxID=2024334 RepID=A0A2Z2RXU3_9CAUD|nr:virion structural protein [Lactococcus phage 05802]ASZ70935.1 adhesion protein B [Lactococcus phage 05802]